jgi:hypothetical protein
VRKLLDELLAHLCQNLKKTGGARADSLALLVAQFAELAADCLSHLLRSASGAIGLRASNARSDGEAVAKCRRSSIFDTPA